MVGKRAAYWAAVKDGMTVVHWVARWVDSKVLLWAVNLAVL